MSTLEFQSYDSIYDDGPTVGEQYPDLDDRFSSLDDLAARHAEEERLEIGWEPVEFPRLKQIFSLGGRLSLDKLARRQPVSEELPPPVID